MWYSTFSKVEFWITQKTVLAMMTVIFIRMKSLSFNVSWPVILIATQQQLLRRQPWPQRRLRLLPRLRLSQTLVMIYATIIVILLMIFSWKRIAKSIATQAGVYFAINSYREVRPGTVKNSDKGASQQQLQQQPLKLSLRYVLKLVMKIVQNLWTIRRHFTLVLLIVTVGVVHISCPYHI